MTDSLTVITVAWNSGESLIRWAREWSACGCSLLVADNESVDGAPGSCGARVVETGGNIGFGMGINVAARAAESDLILVTNPDTLPTSSSSLPALLERFEPDSITGGQLVDSSGELMPSGGSWPTLPWIAGQVVGKTPSLWHRDRVDWIHGALMLVRRDLFLDTLDGFSSVYPLYFEDTDLCTKAVSSGMKCIFAEDAVFLHHEGTGAPLPRKVRLAAYHWGLWRWFVAHRHNVSGIARTLLVLKCTGRMATSSGETRDGYRASLSALLQGRKPDLPQEFDAGPG